ncbi:hypothetical protein ACQCVB_08840 [Fictibacillus phosphorivorans]|uniref:hypothetical protein n=1 Tax=Fictibacillus phosphorivorans TaxID=1221500 RepID=UPI003CED1B72
MKRLLGLLIILMLLTLTSCGQIQNSISSIIIVTGKGHSEDNKEYWITAYDPNKEGKTNPFKVIVEEVMVWNLIEENKEYFSTYAKEGESPWLLEQIEFVK